MLDALARKAQSLSGRESCLGIFAFQDSFALEHVRALFREAETFFGEYRFRPGDFPDLRGVFGFLEQGRGHLDLDALFAVAEVLTLAKTVSDLLEEAEASSTSFDRYPFLIEKIKSTEDPVKTRSALKRCLGKDGLLRDEASPELFTARQEIRGIHQTCTTKVKDFTQREGLAGFLQDDFMTISSDRYVLPLRTNFKGKVDGIVHDYSQTGETCYVEPFFLVELNNRLQELKQEEREAELAVMMFLTGLVRQEESALRGAFDLLVDLDVLQAKVAFAAELDAVLPEIDENAPLRLIAARHPVLMLGGKRDKVVPQNIMLESDQRGLVISGANAGGKTVCLKTLGLLAFMAHCGLPIPAEEGSSLPFFKKFFVFLGDEQSLEDHVSTFTAQIRHLSEAWPEIDSHTLVLLDEFGAGTDPTQGAALAQAVLDALIEQEAYVAAATHFPALKAHALATDGVRAAGMLFDPKTKKPLYKIVYDQVGASIALDVAREHGLPDAILQKANRYLLLDDGDSTSVFDRLNTLAMEREELLNDLRRQQKEYDERKKRLVAHYERLTKELTDEMRGHAREILRQWEANKIGRKKALDELGKARKKLEEAGHELRAEKKEETQPKTINISSLAAGDSVRLRSFGRSGKVVEVDTRREQVKVDMGGVSLWASIADIDTGIQTQAKPNRSSNTTIVPKTDTHLSMTLDLRGKRADVALSELERYLDSAMLRGANEVEVVHGRGTGALRREVHEFLRRHPAVAGFALAPEDRGGDGMTMVELK